MLYCNNVEIKSTILYFSQINLPFQNNAHSLREITAKQFKLSISDFFFSYFVKTFYVMKVFINNVFRTCSGNIFNNKNKELYQKSFL